MTNQYVKNFLDLASERFSTDSTSMSYLDWVCRNTTLRNSPFSTKGYEFQNQILNDMHPNLSVIKPSQTGLTELQVRKSLAFLIRNPGTSLIFTEPTEDMFHRVSNTRFRPLVSKDKVFNTPQDRENRSARSAGLMQFGQSFLYIVPAVESAATSIPADAVFVDELDLSDQQMVSLFSSRLQNSKYRISQRFSTPTFPSFGVDMDYQTSDQQKYMVRCSHCNHWCHPEFTRDYVHLSGVPESINLIDIDRNYQDSIDFSNSYIGCPKCHSPLDLNDPSLREWVATYPNRIHSRGYRVSPFSTGRLDLPYIFKSLWDYQKNEYIRGFYNTVLGQPYSDGNIQISEEIITECLASPAPLSLENEDELFVGIDMGQTAHIVIGKRDREGNFCVLTVYTIGVHQLVDHCKELVTKYKIRAGAVDRHPYEPTARELFQVTNGVILPVEYRGLKDMNLIYDDFSKLSHGQVNSTWFLDQVAVLVRKNKIQFNGFGMNRRVIIEHFRDMVREEKPGEPARWKKLTGNDHYFHATGFMVVAPQLMDLDRSKSGGQVERRTMALGTVTSDSAGISSLIGVSKKRVERGPLSR